MKRHVVIILTPYSSLSLLLLSGFQPFSYESIEAQKLYFLRFIIINSPWGCCFPTIKTDHLINSHIDNSMTRRTSASLSLELFEQHQGTHILQSLDGFVLTLNNDGRFLYISETVSIYLGLSQVSFSILFPFSWIVCRLKVE